MKALVGALDNRPLPLLAELTALRTRVAELQRELATSEAQRLALRAEVDQLRSASEREVVLTH